LGGPGQVPQPPEGSGSIGRAPVSKTGGWGFESLLPCEAASTTSSIDWQQNEEGSIVTETRAQRSPSEGRPSDRGRTGLGLFLRQVIAELRKVIWPTRDQLTTYFIVVLVFVLFMIAFVSVLDFGFNKAAFAIFG
jgi:preprotein translocase subunit SecE